MSRPQPGHPPNGAVPWAPAEPQPTSPSVLLEYAARTDVGMVRSRNEDSFAVLANLNAFIVADGMGGHKGGDVASREACLSIEDHIRARSAVLRGFEADPTPVRRREVIRLLSEAIRVASERIVMDAEIHSDRQGMATTAVVALLVGGRCFVAHVGDSRAYLIRDGRVHLLTEDHSLLFELVKQGRISATSSFPYRNVVTRALGIRGAAMADIVDFDLWPGDRLLLCTDGLHSYLDDPTLLRIVGGSDTPDAVSRLVAFANESGGSDNITAILVDVKRVAGDEAALRSRERVLASLPIFSTLPFADLLRLVSLCEQRVLEDGEVLFREGDSADGLYAVLSGEVEVRRGGEGIARFGPGQELGEMSLLERRPRLVTGVARGNSEVLFLSRSTFDSVIRRSPILASRLLSNLVRVLSHRLRDAHDELAILKSQYANGGLAPPVFIPSDCIEEDGK